MNARDRITAAATASTLTLLISCGGDTGASSPGPASQSVANQSVANRGTASQGASCSPPGGPDTPAKPLKPTTIETVEQAYYCILDNYFAKDQLDDRILLTAAFAGFTQELQRRGRDNSDATMPALTGDKAKDIVTFTAAYRRATAQLSRNANQPVAAATMTAMVAALDDNHAAWSRPSQPPDAKPGDTYGLGISQLSGTRGATRIDPAATPPLFVVAVDAGSPAARQGIRAGDVLVEVNGSSPFPGNVLSEGVLSLINQQYPDRESVRLTLRRPSTGRTWAARLEPASYPAPSSAVKARLLAGDIAYVALTEFAPGVAQEALQAIERLRAKTNLRGVVFDLRGRRGGSPIEVDNLLGAFVHGKITAYHCDAKNNCVPNRTNDSIPLLGLPMVAVTGRSCRSACEHFSSAVKDLRVGKLVGTRSSGSVSGPAGRFVLNDNSTLVMPSLHHLGPNHEVVNEIGVAPDYFEPRTAKDLSTGRDPAVDKAIDLLKP